MNFGFTEEQELLREQVRRFLDKECPLSAVRKIAETKAGFSPDLWNKMAGLGWLGITIPENYGGLGMGWVDLIVVLEECGRSLFPSPIISHNLAISALLTTGTEQQKEAWLPKMAAGQKHGCLAINEKSNQHGPEGVQLSGQKQGAGYSLTGKKHFISDATSADFFIIAFRTGERAEDVALALVESDSNGIEVTLTETMDKTKREGLLTLNNLTLSEEQLLTKGPSVPETLARLFELGAVAVTAESVGAAETALSITTQYAKERYQFGSLIGRYQGVKHPLADMYVDIESYKSLVYYAAWAADDNTEALPRSASIAKAYASDAFARIGTDSIQLHGAIGYTDEYDIQLFIKRSKWMRPAFGDTQFHQDRIAALSF